MAQLLMLPNSVTIHCLLPLLSEQLSAALPFPSAHVKYQLKKLLTAVLEYFVISNSTRSMNLFLTFSFKKDLEQYITDAQHLSTVNHTFTRV